MGRHAYHSPEMILKIRQANQNNEPAGEGDGVPWRHRLGISERREFVMAEIRRPGVGKDRARGIELDIQRAVMAARNPKDSKFGECLINVNTKQDPVLKSRLGRLTTEKRRMEFRLQQLRQHFIKTNPSTNHEPLILVERPASPQVRHRAKVIEDSGEDPDDLAKPGYMKPLRSRCRTPSTLTTIDAFTLKTKKKRNVWEEAMDEKEPPRFTSTIRPAARLTRHEQAALTIGWDAHKPKVDAAPAATSKESKDAASGKGGKASPKFLLPIQGPAPVPRKQLTSASQQQPKQQQQQEPQQQQQPEPEPEQEEGSFFVTQLPRGKDLSQTPQGRLLLLRTDELDRLLAITTTSTPSASDPGPVAAPETAEAAETAATEAKPEESPAETPGEEASETEAAAAAAATAEATREVSSPPPHSQLQQKTSRPRKVAISETPIFITS